MQQLAVYIRSIINQSFSEQLLPSPLCILCRQPSRRTLARCPECEQDLPWLGPHCHQCAEPLPEPPLPEQSLPKQQQPQNKTFVRQDPGTSTDRHYPVCGRCLKKPLAFERTFAPLLYQFPVDNLIHRFKQNADISTTQLLCHLFIQQLSIQQGSIQHRPIQYIATEQERAPLSPAKPLPEQLVPVPLHPRRLYQRGFNQSVELAHQLGQALLIKVNDCACRRVLDTPHQQGLTAKQRRRNLRRAFVVDGSQLSQTGATYHIAVIDDVLTTGTTAQALAQQLKRAGAGQVDIWCLARTPPGRGHQ